MTRSSSHSIVPTRAVLDITQTGVRGGASYSLSEYAVTFAEGRRRPRLNRRLQIVRLLELHVDLAKSDVSAMLDVSDKTAEHWLRVLKSEGLVQPNTPARGSPLTRYRLTRKALQRPLVGDDSDASS